mgnify:CR=1 FL=1
MSVAFVVGGWVGEEELVPWLTLAVSAVPLRRPPTPRAPPVQPRPPPAMADAPYWDADEALWRNHSNTTFAPITLVPSLPGRVHTPVTVVISVVCVIMTLLLVLQVRKKRK